MSANLEKSPNTLEEGSSSSSIEDDGNVIVGASGWKTDSYHGLTDAEVEDAKAIYGLNEIPKHVVPTWLLFVRQFVGFMPLLMEIAALISIATLDYSDFGIIIVLLCVNAAIGFREEYKAKKSLEELSASIESEVTVIRTGVANAVNVRELVPGDIMMLVGGTHVPADIKWIRGDVISVDTAALTGEPIPRKYPGEHGHIVLAGTTIMSGECYGQIVATGTQTEMGQAQADVIKDKSITVVSHFQARILRVVQVTVGFSLIVVLCVFFVQGFARNQFYNGHTKEAIMSALSIMIAAIPIALPLVMQINMALGASHLAKAHNAIVTSLPALQDIASMSILCSDKTGTLTTAKMSIMLESAFTVPESSPEQLLLYAFLAANADKKDDPIDKAIVAAFYDNPVAQSLLKKHNYKQSSIIGFNPVVKRVVAFAEHDDGKLTIAKGLVAKIVDTHSGQEDDGEIQFRIEQLKDNAFMENMRSCDLALSKKGYKTIGISVCEYDARGIEEPVFRFVGLLPMLDPPRHDTTATIDSLHHANISVKMITGDHQNVGRETARLIGLGTNILQGSEIRSAANEETKAKLIWDADGFAAVLPSDKREVVLTLRNSYGIVTGMTGDGVNDAPALSAAEVGIAVEGSTDAAKNAAALILTEPGLSPIYGAVIAARKIFARIKAYVVYRIAASLILVACFGIVTFATGCTVEPLFVILLALFNDLSMVPVAYDRADATRKPQVPRATTLVSLSLYFAVCHTICAIIMFFVIAKYALDDFDMTTDEDKTCPGPTQGFIWLYLLMATEWMIFSARAPKWFWGCRPSWKLLASVFITSAIGVVMAKYIGTVTSEKDPRFVLGTSSANIGWIALSTIVVFIVIDFGKVVFRHAIGDDNVDIIAGEGLIGLKDPSVAPSITAAGRTDANKMLGKQMRQQVHKQCVIPAKQRTHEQYVSSTSLASNLFSMQPTFTDGYIRRAPSSVNLDIRKTRGSELNLNFD